MQVNDIHHDTTSQSSGLTGTLCHIGKTFANSLLIGFAVGVGTMAGALALTALLGRKG